MHMSSTTGLLYLFIAKTFYGFTRLDNELLRHLC